MIQEKFANDLVKAWQLSNCSSSTTPGNHGTPVRLPKVEAESVSPKYVHQAQKLSGSSLWLGTRSRPDISSTRSRPDTSYAQSRFSSMATKNQILALDEGKRKSLPDKVCNHTNYSILKLKQF